MIGPDTVHCHVCGTGVLREIPESRSFRGVASDCQPWPVVGAIAACDACGAVQKPIDAAWRAQATAIYATYDLYHQATGGAEQSVFDQATGAAQPRSRRILESAVALVPLPERGRMLDVGCGTGATLRAFSGLRPNWDLYGVDPNLKDADAISNITGVKRVFECPPEDIDSAFDLISIIHVLEHVEDPAEFLSAVAGKLRPGGNILIEVPYFPRNPFDLLVTDHCTHFTVATLLAVLADVGLTPLAVRWDIVDKELTAVVGRGGKVRPAGRSSDQREPARAAQSSLDWLARLRVLAKRLAEGPALGLFGTSISANWLYGELDGHIAFFVDEDVARVGTTYRGHPVYSPSTAPPKADLLMVLPRPLADTIARRMTDCPATIHLPPEYSPTMLEPPLPR